MKRRATAIVVAAAGILVAVWIARERSDDTEHGPWLAPPVANRGAPVGTESQLPTPVESDASPHLQPERREHALPFASGLVVDEADHPLAGVAIVARPARARGSSLEARPLFEDEFGERTLTRTDASGRFEVGELPTRTASLLLVASDRAPAEWRELSADRAANQGQLFTLARARVVEGVVRDSGGATIGRAVVQWFAASTKREWVVLDHWPEQPLCAFWPGEASAIAVVDAGGRFRFERLPAERGELVATAAGYDETSLDEAELAAANGAIVLERGAVVIEPVAAEDGRPLDDATAIVIDPNGAEVTWLPEPGAFDDDGFAARRAIRSRLCWWYGAATAASLTVAAPGRRSRTLEVALPDGGEPPRFVVPLELGRDEPSLAGRIVGADAATIELRLALTDDPMRPLARRPALASAVCDAARDFVFRGLPPCRVRLDLFAVGCAPLRCELDLPATGVVLEFAPAARIDAVVRDRLDRPVAGVVVRAQTVASPRAWQATSGDDGTCRFDGLPPGELLVGAFPGEVAGARGITLGGRGGDHPPSFPPTNFRADEHVTLAAGERRDLVVRLPEPAPCRLRVVDEHGAPQDGVTIDLTAVDGDGWCTRARGATERPLDRLTTRGLLEVDLVPTRWVVDAGDPPRRVRELFVVEPVRGADVTIVLPSTAPLLRIAGRVVELGTGRPIADATVRAWSDPLDRFRIHVSVAVSSDADGRFEFDELLAGHVTLSTQGAPTIDPATKRSTYPWFTTQVELDLVAGTPVVVELPMVRREPLPADALPVRLQLRDRATGTRLKEGSVVLYAHVGSAIVQFGTYRSDDDGVIALRLPRVERCTASAVAPDFFASDPVTHHAANVELPIVGGSIDAVLELDAVKER